MRLVKLPITSYSAANYVFINQSQLALPVPLSFPLHHQLGAGEPPPGSCPLQQRVCPASPCPKALVEPFEDTDAAS